LLALDSPEWLIEDMVPTGAQAVLYGPSGEGKSFLALDWALSNATGRTWLGRQVKQGRVVYVIGEGGGHMQQRVQA
jgi:RecA-family ATPase